MASGVGRFEAWAEASQANLELRRFPQGTRTAEEAAAAVGCEVGQIVKSLVFLVGGQPVVALVSGANRLDEAALAAAAGGQVGRADATTVRETTGYSIGGVPPFGHDTELPVYCDRDLLQHPTVWAAAGRPDTVFEITPQRLVELSRATVADLRK